MLVLTPNNIHFLCGFVATTRNNQKGNKTSSTNTSNNNNSTAHCVLEWLSPLQQQAEFNKINSNSIETSTIFIEENDNDWIEEIWKELLRSDLGYSRFPLNEIYSFFRRRHQLKYTALEITDSKGYSVLYSCESVEVIIYLFVLLLLLKYCILLELLFIYYLNIFYYIFFLKIILIISCK